MRKSILCALGMAVLMAGVAQAYTITWDGGGANQVWTTVANWDNDQPPASGNDYVVDGVYTIRPVDSNTDTFPGDSLTVTNNARFFLYRTNSGGGITATHTYNNLTIANAKLDPSSSGGSLTHTFPSQITLLGANTMNFASGGSYTIAMNLNGGVTGSGSLNVTRSSQGSTRTLTLSGDNSGYSGNWTISSSSADTMTFQLNNSTGWGTGNVSLGNYASLVLNANVIANSSVITLTDAQARVTVNASKSVSVGNITNTVAGGTLTINGTLAAGANDADSAFSGVIAGAGAFSKTGNGTLTLGGVNTYTGNTTVAVGTLNLSANAELKFVIAANGINNKLAGSGTVNLDAKFRFDLTGASIVSGSSWQIVDVASLTETFGATFSVVSTLGSFTKSGGNWLIKENGVSYQFSESTGLLRVLPGGTLVSFF